MTRTLRRTHLWMWVVMTPIVLGVLIAALVARAGVNTSLRSSSATTEGGR